MKHPSVYKIAVLDDSPVYSNVLSQHLLRYAKSEHRRRGAIIHLQTFTSSQDFIEHIDPETDLAFIDYYLENAITASEVLPMLRVRAPRCSVVIISRSLDAKSLLRSPSAAASFILKDKNGLTNSSRVLAEWLDDQIGSPTGNSAG